MAKKTYGVTLPIAGHAYVEVEAESEEEAIEFAMSSEITNANLEGWETLNAFHHGNVCHCPQPWEATAGCIDGEEDETA